MKQLKFFRFIDGKLESVESFTLTDNKTDGYTYLVVLIVDGIPVRSLII